jgi:hypothetical protein
MNEMRIFLCSWSRTPSGYRVWVIDDPAVAAEASDFDDADELLYERILEVTGDGENQHEYVPPRPVPSAGHIERGRLWQLGQTGMVRMHHELPYFEGGLCENCLMPLGPRTALPLEVTPLAGSVNAASVRLDGVALGEGPSLTIVSERLLGVFTEEERAAFEWRLVSGVSKKDRFFELLPVEPTSPFVSPIGIPAQFRRCADCGFIWTAVQRRSGQPDWYVSEASLPSPSRSLVAVRQWPQAILAVTDERWETLVGRQELKGIQGTAIAVIAPEAVQQPADFIPRERAPRKW